MATNFDETKLMEIGNSMLGISLADEKKPSGSEKAKQDRTSALEEAKRSFLETSDEIRLFRVESENRWVRAQEIHRGAVAAAKTSLAAQESGALLRVLEEEHTRLDEAEKEADARRKEAYARFKEADARREEAYARWEEAYARWKEADARWKEADARAQEADARRASSLRAGKRLMRASRRRKRAWRRLRKLMRNF
jgi:hypothetical protein